MCWLLSQHSVETVATVCRTIASLPDGMNELQRSNVIAGQAGELPTMPPGREFGSESEAPLVLCPPTSVCYEFGGDLSRYHSCRVKCYGLQGMKKAKKNTSRCAGCRLLHNYAQFGNERELGFRSFVIHYHAFQDLIRSRHCLTLVSVHDHDQLGVRQLLVYHIYLLVFAIPAI